jgi:hypothetical protein
MRLSMEKSETYIIIISKVVLGFFHFVLGIQGRRPHGRRPQAAADKIRELLPQRLSKNAIDQTFGTLTSSGIG